MTYLLVGIMLFFWAMIIYYTVLTITGVYYYSKRKTYNVKEYPSVDVLVPAHNEGIVIQKTLEALSRLAYPGEMNIYVLNDNSTDETGEIADAFDEAFVHMHHIRVPSGEPKGKSRVLNYGLSLSQSTYFIVFDADNQPAPTSVQALVEAAQQETDAAGAVGYVRTINANKNFLTRMIAQEFQVHQLLMQCGRWQLFKTGSLTGTNMLLKRSVINSLGGYDPYALAEDAELTVRITQKGWTLPIVPHAETWEQEPETIKALVKQRTRWLQGNLYLLEKMFKHKEYWHNKTFVHSFQHSLVYLFFVLFLTISHIFFFCGLFGIPFLHTESPLLLLWFMSYIVYTLQHISAMVLSKTVSFKNWLTATFMYFTYSQIFLILLTRSLILYIQNKRKGTPIAWDKTIRF